jgi:ABC-type antimicrobial peptide transport system permease subunit
MALGAMSTEILLSFGKRGLVMTIAGLGIGLLLAVIVARSMTRSRRWLVSFPRAARQYSIRCWRFNMNEAVACDSPIEHRSA